MKQTIKLNLIEQSLVIEAMEAKRKALKGINRDRFDLVVEKVKAKIKHYDSEEMLYIVQSLMKYCKILRIYGESFEDFRTLAKRIDRLREFHQEKYHPLKREKAQTAGTVNAS